MTALDEMSPRQITQCCAALYESDVARMLLGASFHPGGAVTTRRLGEMMGLSPASRVLDVACGAGASALILAERFGCSVTGVDLSAKNVAEASDAAAQRGLDGQVRFVVGDASALDVAEAAFDAILCECAFCLFPDKNAAAREFARIVKPGGVLGLSDLTRDGAVPADLEGLLAWVACIADAQPIAIYRDTLTSAGFRITTIEAANGALADLVQQMRLRLLSAEIMVGLKRLALPGFDFAAAKRFAKAALAAIDRGQLGYVLLSGVRS